MDLKDSVENESIKEKQSDTNDFCNSLSDKTIKEVRLVMGRCVSVHRRPSVSLCRVTLTDLLTTSGSTSLCPVDHLQTPDLVVPSFPPCTLDRAVAAETPA